MSYTKVKTSSCSAGPCRMLSFVHVVGLLSSASRFVRCLSPQIASISANGGVRHTMSKMIDIGANLLDPCFQGRYHGGSQKHEPDLDDVIERAINAGVGKMIVTAGSLQEAKDALELSSKYPCLYSTVGVHPTRSSEFSADGDPEAHLAALLGILKAGKSTGKVVAVGECGLDYDRLQFCSKEEQLAGFELQFELSAESGLPIFFHSRASATDFLGVVGKNRDRFSGGVVHSFDGTQAEAQDLVDMGLYIGINGCSLKTEENLEASILSHHAHLPSIPSDWLMLETDSPWCEIRPSHAGSGFIRTKLPCKKKEKFEAGVCVKGRQEPCHMVQVLEVVAAVRGEDEGELGRQVLENTQRLFFPSD
ncbi:unnamed protein product [Choristocarpus tenellus]